MDTQCQFGNVSTDQPRVRYFASMEPGERYSLATIQMRDRRALADQSRSLTHIRDERSQQALRRNQNPL